MSNPRLIVLPAALLLLALAGCSAGGSDADPGGGSSTGASSAASDGGTDGGTDVAASAPEACGLVDTDLLAAVLDADPGEGKAEESAVGTQCTWTVSPTVSVLIQATGQSDVYFPDGVGVYDKPDTAQDVDGVDRGWVDEESQSILLVKGSTGILLNVIAFGADGDPTQLPALADSIAAKL